MIEPALSGSHTYLNWLSSEYGTNVILEHNRKNPKSDNVEYYSIGSRIYNPNNQLSFTHSKIFHYNPDSDNHNDGIVCLEESREGIIVANLLHSHYDLLSLGKKKHSNLFEIYSNHFKMADIEALSYINH